MYNPLVQAARIRRIVFDRCCVKQLIIMVKRYSSTMASIRPRRGTPEGKGLGMCPEKEQPSQTKRKFGCSVGVSFPFLPPVEQTMPFMRKRCTFKNKSISMIDSIRLSDHHPSVYYILL